MMFYKVIKYDLFKDFVRKPDKSIFVENESVKCLLSYMKVKGLLSYMKNNVCPVR